ncbi:MAG TPA: polysaccharide biosynthesis/export family protein [Gemmatirosa sp.]
MPGFAAAQRAAEVAVGVGDRVRVRVWREPTMSDDFTVDDRGSVTLPRLGPVPVAGHSIASVRDTLLARYAEYLKNPSVDVTVLRRVSVQGEVRLPNLYYVDATKSIREVVAEAGGPTDAANRDHVALVRDSRTVAVGRWSDGGPVGVDLRSGDEVVVGRRSWISLNALAVVGAVGVLLPVGLTVINSLKK